MRKSYDGLYALARQSFETDPLAGHLFVFANRRATQIKVLYFDRSGWCLWGKRLENKNKCPASGSASKLWRASAYRPS